MTSSCLTAYISWNKKNYSPCELNRLLNPEYVLENIPACHRKYISAKYYYTTKYIDMVFFQMWVIAM